METQGEAAQIPEPVAIQQTDVPADITEAPSPDHGSAPQTPEAEITPATSPPPDARTTPVDGSANPSRAEGSLDGKTPAPDEAKSLYFKQPGSEASSANRRKRKETPVESGAHRVTFTVTISEAIPTEAVKKARLPIFNSFNSLCSSLNAVEDDDTQDGMESRRKRRIVEAPRAQNYLHCEYSLLPDDEEVVKTDVVTYGVAAKIYTERQDAKVLKTWIEGDRTWVAWTHAHTLTVTDELLTRLFKHELQLRVWDTRDKLSTRARYDRPKAFKLPTAKPGEDVDGGGVKPLVLNQVATYESLQPKKSYIARPLPTHTRSSSEMDIEIEKDKVLAEVPRTGDIPDRVVEYVESTSQLRGPRPQSPTPNTLVQVPTSAKAGDSAKSYSRLGKLAGVPPPSEQQAKLPSASKSSPLATKSKAPLKPTPKNSSTSARAASIDKNTDSNKRVTMNVKADEGLGSGDIGSSLTTFPTQDNKSALPEGEQEQPQEENERKGSAGSQPRTDTKPRRSKKQEAAAQARAELIKKHGMCSISIPMAKLFADLSTVTERLDRPVNNLHDMFITVSLSGPLMSKQQHRRLNPLVVKVVSATDMPNTPLDYDELRAKCEPAYLKYSLLDMPVHRSVGREPDENIYWNDIHVVLAGTMEPSRLREYINGPPVDIEIHDRDRIIEKQKLKPTLFGDDLEDEKISNVGTISSKRTTHNPFGEDKPWDPYGVARLDLSGLLLGEKIIHMKLPIHQCEAPDILGVKEGQQDNRLVGVSGAVDGPVSLPLPQGHYLQSGAGLKVKVEIAYPLVSPAQIACKVSLEHASECPFARIVYKFGYKNVSFLASLQSYVSEVNATALGLGDMPPHVIKAALSTYKLTKEQQVSGELDIITGFQVLDGDIHLFVLEGLCHGGLQHLWQSLKRPENSDVQVLYHSDMAFSRRLYGPLDVDLTRIKLHQRLADIVKQPLLYVRDMVPKPCFLALTRLDELSRTTKLRSAIRNDLLPSSEMVMSMSKEFGVPLTAEDFEELMPQPPTVSKHDYLEGEQQAHASRVWTPIDNYNTQYMETIQSRNTDDNKVNYSKENKALVREKSMMNCMERHKQPTIRVPANTAYNYSTQTLNSTEQAKEGLRKMLAQSPDSRYTYCPEYHRSMTVVPVNVDALKKSEEIASQDAWKTPDGWVYPGKKTMIESNLHPRKLHVARAEELQQSWEDLSRLPKGVSVPRSGYPWHYRYSDFDTWTRPAPVFGKDDPITIHLAGQKLREERQQAQEHDASTWHSKIIVNDTRNYFHRCATETELRDCGFKSSNQVARLQGLKKDPPMKYTLRKPGLALKEIPPLNVVLNPSVDSESRQLGRDVSPAIINEFDRKVKGFVPGFDNHASIVVDTNQIPVRDYQHEYFIGEKGHDFNVYHKERSDVHKRRIHPMTEQEYRAHIFRLPDHYESLPKYYTLPDVELFKRHTTNTTDSGFISQPTSKETTKTTIHAN